MAKVEEESCKPDDVAVIGLACRFPGSASNEAKLWELLVERKSAHSKAPKERYNVDAFHQQDATHPNNLAADGGHFLEQDVKSFDAPFFNITAEEAKAIDLQARMLLECSYEALENAGLSVDSPRERCRDGRTRSDLGRLRGVLGGRGEGGGERMAARRARVSVTGGSPDR